MGMDRQTLTKNLEVLLKWARETGVKLNGDSLIETLKAAIYTVKLCDEALDMLVEMEVEMPCEWFGGDGWCLDCRTGSPTAECWERFLMEDE